MPRVAARRPRKAAVEGGWVADGVESGAPRGRGDAAAEGAEAASAAVDAALRSATAAALSSFSAGGSASGSHVQVPSFLQHRFAEWQAERHIWAFRVSAILLSLSPLFLIAALSLYGRPLAVVATIALVGLVLLSLPFGILLAASLARKADVRLAGSLSSAALSDGDLEAGRLSDGSNGRRPRRIAVAPTARVLRRLRFAAALLLLLYQCASFLWLAQCRSALPAAATATEVAVEGLALSATHLCPSAQLAPAAPTVSAVALLLLQPLLTFSCRLRLAFTALLHIVPIAVLSVTLLPVQSGAELLSSCTLLLLAVVAAAGWTALLFAQSRTEEQLFMLALTAKHSAQGQSTAVDRLQSVRRELKQTRRHSSAWALFIARVMQEVQLPVHAIHIALDHLLHNSTVKLGSHWGRLLNMSLGSTERLEAMLSQVLDMNAMERGRFFIDTRAFRLDAAVGDVVDEMQGLAARKGVPLRVRMALSRAFFCVLGDGARVKQIVRHLLSNALKFTEDGEVTVTLSLLSDPPHMSSKLPRHRSARAATTSHRTSARHRMAEKRIKSSGSRATDGGLPIIAGPPSPRHGAESKHGAGDDDSAFWVRLRVDDSGCGISVSKLKTIWQPTMPKNDVDSPHKTSGLGIGLALTRRIVEMMHGRVNVQSRVGSGTSFIIDLPLHLASASHVRAMHRAEEAMEEAEATMPFTPIHALLVECDALRMRQLLSSLQGLGHSAHLVSSAQAAVDHVIAEGFESFDAVFMDGSLPDIDGFPLAKVLKALGMQCPLLGLADYGTAVDDPLASGLDGTLATHFTPHQLQAAVEEHVYNHLSSHHVLSGADSLIAIATKMLSWKSGEQAFAPTGVEREDEPTKKKKKKKKMMSGRKRSSETKYDSDDDDDDEESSYGAPTIIGVPDRRSYSKRPVRAATADEVRRAAPAESSKRGRWSSAA